jgi:predicted O-methyltransferase YrrM
MLARPDATGYFDFSPSAEQLLYKYVKKRSIEIRTDIPSERAKMVIEFIDEFCNRTEHPLNIEPMYKTVNYMNAIRESNSKIHLELGTHIGYYALVALHTMGNDGYVYTIDYNTLNNKIAKKIWKIAGCIDRIRLLNGTLQDVGIRAEISKRQYDTIFMNHNRKAYVTDLMKLENMNIIKHSGTIMACENNIHDTSDYIKYIGESPKYVNTKWFTSHNEDCKKTYGIHIAIVYDENRHGLPVTNKKEIEIWTTIGL